MRKKTLKYKGNTLVEVMIALALTSFASTMAVVIYLNIQQSTQPFFKIRAGNLANKYLNETISTHDFFDRTFEEEGFLVKKQVTKSPVFYDCSDISLKVFDTHNHLLTELHTTVHAD